MMISWWYPKKKKTEMKCMGFSWLLAYWWQTGTVTWSTLEPSFMLLLPPVLPWKTIHFEMLETWRKKGGEKTTDNTFNVVLQSMTSMILNYPTSRRKSYPINETTVLKWKLWVVDRTWPTDKMYLSSPADSPVLRSSKQDVDVKN